MGTCVQIQDQGQPSDSADTAAGCYPEHRAQVYNVTALVLMGQKAPWIGWGALPTHPPILLSPGKDKGRGAMRVEGQSEIA